MKPSKPINHEHTCVSWLHPILKKFLDRSGISFHKNVVCFLGEINLKFPVLVYSVDVVPNSCAAVCLRIPWILMPTEIRLLKPFLLWSLSSQGPGGKFRPPTLGAYHADLQKELRPGPWGSP